MNIQNFFETMNNCRGYIRNNPNVKAAYENLEASSCSGFEYTLQNSVAVKLRVDRKIGFVIMEVYPGITVRGAHQSMVAEYCQRVSECPGAGYLAVDVDQGNVYFHSESSFLDNPVSPELLKMMENAAIAMLDKHTPVIDCLAYGRLPNAPFPLIEAPTEGNTPVCSAEDQAALAMNVEAIRRHLADSGHNVVAENLDSDSSVCFFLETLSGKMRYRELIRIQQNGWLLRTLSLDIKCAEPYRTQLSQYCNAASDETKVGFLKIDTDGYPSCTVASYLLDGELVSKEMLEKMESIAATFLKESELSLMYIGHGVQPPKDSSRDDAMRRIADMTAGILGRHPHMGERKSVENPSPSSLIDLLASLPSGSEGDGDSMKDLLDMLHPDEDSAGGVLDF